MAFDLSMLSLFTGTEHYYRLSRQCLNTDGAKHFADEAGSYRLLEAASAYLVIPAKFISSQHPVLISHRCCYMAVDRNGMIFHSPTISL
jgi:hypothetical protein